MKQTNKMSIQAGKRVIRIESDAVAALEDRIDDSFDQAVELIFNAKGRIIVTGVGKSGVIGRKISSTFTSTGTTSYFLHAAEGAHGDLGMVHRDDIVICLSKSGETEELYNLIAAFKKLNIPIIAMTGNQKSTLARESHIVLDVSVLEEACPHDLAPTTSTTAALVMGDALAIALLEKRKFSKEDFAFFHPGGNLGRRLLTTVDDLMEKDENLPSCSAEDDMKKVTFEMAHKRGICPIIDEKSHLIGVITTGDLNRLLEQTEKFFHLKAHTVMNKYPKSVVSGTLASEALKMMENYRVIAMPVLDKDGQLIGVVHLHDILQIGIST